MKTKALILSSVLLGASVAVAPVQAHDRHHDLWPLYGLTGLILLDSVTSHRHHKHRYYDDHRYHHRHRRHHSHGHYSGHKHKYRKDYRRKYRD